MIAPMHPSDLSAQFKLAWQNLVEVLAAARHSLPRSPPKRSNARPSSRWNGRNSDKSYAPDDRQLTSIRFRLVFTRLVLRPAALDDLSSSDGSLTAQPHSRDTEIRGSRRAGCRTESEFILWTMLADFDPKFLQDSRGFPSERFLVTPRVLIPLAPPHSLGFEGFSGEVRKLRACSGNAH